MKRLWLFFMIAFTVALAAYAQAPHAGEEITFKSIKAFDQSTNQPYAEDIGKIIKFTFTTEGLYKGDMNSTNFFAYKGFQGSAYIYKNQNNAPYVWQYNKNQ